MHQSNQQLTVQQVASILAVSPSHIWAQASSAPDFPKPFKLSAKQARWKQSAVDAYIDAKSATQHNVEAEPVKMDAAFFMPVALSLVGRAQ